MHPSRLLFPAFIFCISTGWMTQSVVAQTGPDTSNPDAATDGLQRVADLLGQLQSSGVLSSPQPAGAVEPEVPTNEMNPNATQANPFSTQGLMAARRAIEGVQANIANRAAAAEPGSSPNVEIGDNVIEIQVGGRAIRVPRRNPGPNVSASQIAGTKITGTQTAEARIPTDLIAGLLPAGRTGAFDRAAIYLELGNAASDFAKGAYEQAKLRLEPFGERMAGEGLPAQVYALTLFQVGDFSSAAEWAHNGLRTSKPLNWETIQGFYGNPADYAGRYKELQQRSRREPDRIELRFLLAYHHLMLGHREYAESELQVVQQALGDDEVVQALSRMASPSLAPPAPLSR